MKIHVLCKSESHAKMMNRKKISIKPTFSPLRIFTALLFIFSIISFPVSVSAVSMSSPILAATSPKVDCVDNQSAANCGITRYILLFINVLSATLGVVVTIVIITAGIQYSASGGDPQAIASAKKRIANALLALVLFAFMYGFLQWIVPGGIL